MTRGNCIPKRESKTTTIYNTIKMQLKIQQLHIIG